MLDGEFDDAPAVQPLAEGESNQNAPLSKDEALKLAAAEFRKIRPKAEIHTTIAEFSTFGKARWNVSFFSDPPLSYPSFTSEAEIIVDGSHRISRDSWIGGEKPRAGNKLTEKDKGPRVRLTVEGDFSRKAFKPTTGSLVSLIGVIDRIGKNSVSGTFTSPAFESPEPKSLSFPTAALRSVQRLAEE